MSITKYPAEGRGVGDIAWLRSRFSFSFARYYDPARMGFGKLRVLNDDTIAPVNGFGMHEHDNMEIVTLVTEGILEHKDSEGNGGTLRADDVQVMSAGSGIAHSEINPSEEEMLALFQLWIETKEQGIKPRYNQKHFEFPENTLTVVASGDGDHGALYIYQDARVMVGNFTAGGKHTHIIPAGRGIFALATEGSFQISTEAHVETLENRDAVEITDAHSVTIETATGGRVLIIEVVV
jgi:redox-sensitive bicupin YhaK (pirin superfamily)